MQQVSQDALRWHSDAMAIVGQHRSLTYRELDVISSRYAAHLSDLGVEPGDHVGLLLPRCPELLIAMLACWRCGAAYVPIDVNNPPERTKRVLDVSQPKVVITRDGLISKLAGNTHVVLTDALEASARCEDSWQRTPEMGSAYVLFTSGSTGQPKGVSVGPAGLKRLLLDNPWADFSAGARWLQVTSPAFDISNVEIWGCLLHGGTLHLIETPLPSLDELADAMLTFGITHAQLSTAVFNALVDTRPDALKGLKQMISGGERASPSHMLKALTVNPELRLVNGYGPTETTIYSLTHRVSKACTQNPAGIPIGLPVLGTKVRLDTQVGGFDKDDTGELWIGGTGLAHGYLGDAEQTARRFILQDGARWYRTGDLARQRADGLYEYLGRIDRQVKLQGQRVEIDEVELALGQCPGVGEVAVLLRDQDPHNKHLAAFYSGLADAAPDVDQVLQHLAGCLVPAAIPKVIRPMDRLPVNINGKVDRAALAQLLNQPALQGSGLPQAWGSPLEKQLAGIWSGRLANAQLNPSSHFLQSGGTSLTALHISADIRSQMGRIFSPAALLQHPVLADQARLLATCPRLTEQARGVNAAGHELAFPLTRGQAALLAASTLDPTGHAYLVHAPLWLEDAIDIGAWQAALTQLASRHPLLRLRGQHDGLQASAVIHPDLAAGWWQTHPDGLQKPDDLNWPEAVTSQLNRPMLPETGMFRVDHWPNMTGGCLVTLTCHHAVVDDAAIELLLAELHELLCGHALPEPTRNEAALAPLEQDLTRLDNLEQWALHLSSHLSAQELPPLTRPPTAGDERGFALDTQTLERLRSASHVAGCTPFPLLLTAFGLSIQAVFGKAYAFTSTPFSRKFDHQLQRTLAYLLDVRFLETGRRPSDRSELDAFDRVRSAAIEAQRPQFQPMDLLAQAVERLSPSAAHALTQFGFTWRTQVLGIRPLGMATAQMMRVPQSGAKYGLCLHVIEQDGTLLLSIEAGSLAFSQGKVDLVQEAFARTLNALTQAVLTRGAVPLAAGAPVQATASAKYLDATQNAWNASLSLPLAQRSSLSSHYLREGGTSLSAMRLTAELRKLHGLKIDLVEFLQNPTLGHLLQLVTPQRHDCVLVGPSHAKQVLLLIPGLGGHAVGLLRLAEAIEQCLPDDTAVAIVELDSILAQAPTGPLLPYITKNILGTISSLPPLMGLMGFSMGGLLAAHVASQSDQDFSGKPLIFLDTYAPRAMKTGWSRRIETQVARVLLGRPHEQAAEIEKIEPLSIRAHRSTWEALLHEVTHTPVPKTHAQIHQIGASEMMKYVGLLWRRQSFGFEPGHFNSWKTWVLPGNHLELPNRLAPQVGQLVGQLVH